MHMLRKLMRPLFAIGAVATLTAGLLSGCGTALHQPFGFTVFHTDMNTPMCTVTYASKKTCTGCDGSATVAADSKTDTLTQAD